MDKIRVAVLGAGAWARFAHIPGWLRDPRCEIVTLCDVEGEGARAVAREFSIPEASDDWQSIVSRPDEPALGAGECAAGPTAAAVANALFNALGVRARDLPLTPDRIARAME